MSSTLVPTALNPGISSGTALRKEVTIQLPADQAELEDESEPIRSVVLTPRAREAARALSVPLEEAIVDLRLSCKDEQDAELIKCGYVQLAADTSALVRRKGVTGPGGDSTFGGKVSLWTWRRAQGTFGGKLRPIIDLRLHTHATSSDFVLAGYTCCTVPVSGQWVWIKRATTEEEERDALVDLHISTGKIKDSNDPIWTSPGVGWVRVDGNFTKSFFGGMDTILWLRPARTRALEAHLCSPIREAVALTDEVRYALLLSATRLALRNHVSLAAVVSVREVRALAGVGVGAVNTGGSNKGEGVGMEMGVGVRVGVGQQIDFTTLYHGVVGVGLMTHSKLSLLLTEVGLHLERADMNLVFNLFDASQSRSITIEDFTQILTLTDYELDLATERVRLHLLRGSRGAFMGGIGGPRSTVGRANSGVLDSGVTLSQPHHDQPRNVIRENDTLAGVFQTITGMGLSSGGGSGGGASGKGAGSEGGSGSAIFALPEMLELAARAEVFLTEQEARRVLKSLDVDGNDRVSEGDFIAFLSRPCAAHVNKAFRVGDAANALRRWLVQGSTNVGSASKQQWKQFGRRYYQVTGRKFPGFLDAQLLMLTMARLGTHLSALEARELTLLVAPEKDGRIHQVDLHDFMGRECRPFGELTALCERELLRGVVEGWAESKAAEERYGAEDADLAGTLKGAMGEFKEAVDTVYTRPLEDPLDQHENHDDGEGMDAVREARILTRERSERAADAQSYGRRGMEIVSVKQLREGAELYWRQQNRDSNTSIKASSSHLPNLEEWASLALLVRAAVAEGEVYGVRVAAFVEGVCRHCVGAREAVAGGKGEALRIVVRGLQRQMHTEAASAGRGRGPDYTPLWGVFDPTGAGFVTTGDFMGTLQQLLLAPPRRLQQPLLDAITKNAVVKIADIQAFAEVAAKALRLKLDVELEEVSPEDEALFDEEEEESDAEDVTSNIPPVKVTGNNDYDRLLWALYREARKVDAFDPEGVLTELQIRCSDTETAQALAQMQGPQAQAPTQRQLQAQAQMRAETHSLRGELSVKQLWAHLYALTLNGTLTLPQFCAQARCVCRPYASYTPTNAPTSTYAPISTSAFTPTTRYSSPHTPVLEIDLVNYETLSADAVKLGRAFHALLQSRQQEDASLLPPLLDDLKAFFKALMDEKVPGLSERAGAARFEKIFRRIDTDGDGNLTAKEFRKGLKRLRFPGIRYWTLRMVRRLFAHMDRNGDGVLSIKEFSTFVCAGQGAGVEEVGAGLELVVGDARKVLHEGEGMELGDGEIQGVKRLTDHQLVRKVNEALMDIVPLDPSAPHTHTHSVRAAVRRFFLRADPSSSGTVGEERFDTFLRRSGLQATLTPSELRRLTHRLRRRGVTRESVNDVVIDYERLCQQLTESAHSVPLSSAEAAMLKLQAVCFPDSTSISASYVPKSPYVITSSVSSSLPSVASRPFLSCCLLVDSQWSGRLSRGELAHVCKMAGCPMGEEEIQALLELLPSGAVGGGVGGQGKGVDYRVLDRVCAEYTPRMSKKHDIEPYYMGEGGGGYGGGMLASFAQVNAHTPSSSMQGLRQSSQPISRSQSLNQSHSQMQAQMQSRSYDGGFPSDLPPDMPSMPSRLDHTVRLSLARTGGGGGGVSRSMSGGMGGMDMGMVGAPPSELRHLVELLAARVRVGVDAKSRDWGAPFSLRRLFEAADGGGGLVGGGAFEGVLGQVGVRLGGADVQALRAVFGGTNSYGSGGGDIDCHRFCLLVEASQGGGISTGGAGVADSGSYGRASASGSMGATMGMGGSMGGSMGVTRRSLQPGAPAPYLHPRCLRRLREILTTTDPMSLFSPHDPLNRGTVSVSRFREVVGGMQLLQTEHQMSCAVDAFACSDRSQVVYGDFLGALAGAAAQGRVSLSGSLRQGHGLGGELGEYGGEFGELGGLGGGGFVDGSGYDGLRKSSTERRGREAESPYSHQQQPQEEYKDRFQEQQYQEQYQQQRQSDQYQQYTQPQYQQPQSSYASQQWEGGIGGGWGGRRDEQGNQGLMPPKLADSVNLPPSTFSTHHAPPARPVRFASQEQGQGRGGTSMGMSAGAKGWACSVCRFAQNPEQAQMCSVCDAPNYSQHKEHQVTEQCSNCRFANAQAADECEMCGEPLAGSRGNYRHK